MFRFLYTDTDSFTTAEVGIIVCKNVFSITFSIRRCIKNCIEQYEGIDSEIVYLTTNKSWRRRRPKVKHCSSYNKMSMVICVMTFQYASKAELQHIKVDLKFLQKVTHIGGAMLHARCALYKNPLKLK